ncbi:hypothetical protein Hypma_000620 [Hypsizygus marmoreus]|uniref:Uncharacterized protein n=1 Tax=Hypsizygus marmoreus TaxID=39966 RepID=A0A369JA72_HYPMA|nr:hypothetical protein Hypma_000620 [Hypsizygus marmoreus]
MIDVHVFILSSFVLTHGFTRRIAGYAGTKVTGNIWRGDYDIDDILCESVNGVVHFSVCDLTSEENAEIALKMSCISGLSSRGTRAERTVGTCLRVEGEPNFASFRNAPPQKEGQVYWGGD